MRKLSSLISVFALMTAATDAQTALIPNPAVHAGGGSSANIWRAGINRVQGFYDSTNFTGQNVGQPIVISGIEWRCIAAVAAPITYPSVEIYLQNAAVNFSTPSTTFASNRTVAFPTTPNYAGPVTVNAGPAGTYCINLPLTNTFTYSPEAGNDLLVEIVILAAPTPLTGTSMDCGFNNPLHLCNSVRSVGSTTALTGSASAFAPIIRLTYSDAPGAATHTSVGAGCYARARSFYELFPGSTADLTGQTVTMTQNVNGGYDVVTAAGGLITPPTSVGLALADDQVTAAAIPLPFTFDYPGGSTAGVFIDSNGSILLNGTAASNLGGTAAILLTSAVHRLCPSMQDLLPDGALNVANVYAEPDPANPTTVFLITWLNVPCFGALNPSTFQVALIDNGTNDSVEMRYTALFNDSSSNAGVAITGFSNGGGAIDPGSSDLTAGPISTQTDLGPLALSASPRPIMTVPVTYTVSNIRPNTGLSGMIISFGNTGPTPLSTYGLNAPGCFAYVDVLNSVSFGPLLIGSPTQSYTTTWPFDPSYVGALLYLQGAELALLENPGGVISSNSLVIKLGTQ